MTNSYANSEKNYHQVKVFIELYVRDITYNITLFSEVLGFSVIRDEGNFAELHSGNSMLLLNDGSDLELGHPFRGRLDPINNGIGTEIGFDVSDVSAVYKKASQFNGLKMTEIKLQSWGLKDFRVVTPDNYYLRVTELHK